MHSTTVIACHTGKMNHECMIFGNTGVLVLVIIHMLFGEPELRPSIGLSGLQGPGRVREKQEKERSELRDLVKPDDLPVNEAILLYVMYFCMEITYIPLLCIVR